MAHYLLNDNTGGQIMEELKILIVDDSGVVRKIIESLIRDFKLNVVGTASNGREALEIFKIFKPEIVTLDITMPEMDGLECLTRMKQLHPESKIIVISALKDKETAMRAIKLGASSFIPKPFIGDDLKLEIKALIEEIIN